MPKEQEVICIICPSACVITVTFDDGGNVLGVVNNLCKEGKKYAIAECKFPGRILTTTLPTVGSSRRLLPVRTNKPVRKGQIMDCMRYLSGINVKPPIKIGQVVVPDIAATGVDLVASDDLPT
jgi:CxxC motif-containing protein